ncbi:hypothetical protein CBL_10718 [Carabus blaptoides fortunei]
MSNGMMHMRTSMNCKNSQICCACDLMDRSTNRIPTAAVGIVQRNDDNRPSAVSSHRAFIADETVITSVYHRPWVIPAVTVTGSTFCTGIFASHELMWRHRRLVMQPTPDAVRHRFIDPPV